MSDSANTQADAGVQRAADAIVARRLRISASELSIYQSIRIDFCGLLGIEAPRTKADQSCMLERPIFFAHSFGINGASRTNLNNHRHVEPMLVGIPAKYAPGPAAVTSQAHTTSHRPVVGKGYRRPRWRSPPKAGRSTRQRSCAASTTALQRARAGPRLR